MIFQIKLRRLAVCASLVLLSACSSVPRQTTSESGRKADAAPTGSASVATTHAPAPVRVQAKPAPANGGETDPRLALAGEMLDPVTPPDATLYIDARSGKMNAQSDRLLRNIAEQLKNDDTLLARLESYVPDSGSRAYELGMASRQVESVRQQLVDLGIPRYRVKVAAYGSERPDTSHRNNNSVDLYIVHVQR
jgi:outer membrane protein OmpA-like peptidoglycan-associated protein